MVAMFFAIAHLGLVAALHQPLVSVAVVGLLVIVVVLMIRRTMTRSAGLGMTFDGGDAGHAEPGLLRIGWVEFDSARDTLFLRLASRSGRARDSTVRVELTAARPDGLVRRLKLRGSDHPLLYEILARWLHP